MPRQLAPGRLQLLAQVHLEKPLELAELQHVKPLEQLFQLVPDEDLVHQP